MEIALFCLILCFPVEATLRGFPDRSQFFRYENITLTCTAPDNTGSWKVKRNTSTETAEVCKFGWGIPGESSCNIESAYPSDTGVYWCESEQRGSSNTVNITVTDDVLILESPLLPVTEGDAVNLSCLYRKEEEQVVITSGFSAVFYKDNVFIGTEPAGKMILMDVSKSHEGFYKCGHSRHVSRQSFLTVKVRQPDVPTATPPVMSKPKLLCTILLFILYTGILLFAIYTYRKWAQVRAEAKRGSF